MATGTCYEDFVIGGTIEHPLRPKSDPRAGIVTVRHKGLDQHDDIICDCVGVFLMQRRPTD